MKIKAIETQYAGCRFRSRLEARWAVFFDQMKIRWEYEAQGFEVSRRCYLSGAYDDMFRYLPDFWLPDLDVYAEVKGSLTDQECLRLLDAAGHLSSPVGGCNDGGGHDLVVLGPVPDPRLPAIPLRLHLHKGDLTLTIWALAREGCPSAGSVFDTIADDSGRLHYSTADIIKSLLGGHVQPSVRLSRRYTEALSAARSARFEHGERG
jgi:hypothetical protein